MSQTSVTGPHLALATASDEQFAGGEGRQGGHTAVVDVTDHELQLPRLGTVAADVAVIPTCGRQQGEGGGHRSGRANASGWQGARGGQLKPTHHMDYSGLKACRDATRHGLHSSQQTDNDPIL